MDGEKMIVNYDKPEDSDGIVTVVPGPPAEIQLDLAPPICDFCDQTATQDFYGYVICKAHIQDAVDDDL